MELLFEQCLFQVALLHKKTSSTCFCILHTERYVTIHIITAQWWEAALLLWSTTLMFPRENTCEFLFTLQYIILVLHRLKSKGGIQLPTAPEAPPVMHLLFFSFFLSFFFFTIIGCKSITIGQWRCAPLGQPIQRSLNIHNTQHTAVKWGES